MLQYCVPHCTPMPAAMEVSGIVARPTPAVHFRGRKLACCYNLRDLESAMERLAALHQANGVLKVFFIYEIQSRSRE